MVYCHQRSAVRSLRSDVTLNALRTYRALRTGCALRALCTLDALRTDYPLRTIGPLSARSALSALRSNHALWTNAALSARSTLRPLRTLRTCGALSAYVALWTNSTLRTLGALRALRSAEIALRTFFSLRPTWTREAVRDERSRAPRIANKSRSRFGDDHRRSACGRDKLLHGGEPCAYTVMAPSSRVATAASESVNVAA